MFFKKLTNCDNLYVKMFGSGLVCHLLAVMGLVHFADSSDAKFEVDFVHSFLVGSWPWIQNNYIYYFVA